MSDDGSLKITRVCETVGDGIYTVNFSANTFTASAAELRERGIEIRLPEKRSSTVLFCEKL